MIYAKEEFFQKEILLFYQKFKEKNTVLIFFLQKIKNVRQDRKFFFKDFKIWRINFLNKSFYYYYYYYTRFKEQMLFSKNIVFIKGSNFLNFF